METPCAEKARSNALSTDDYFMTLAVLTAMRSKDPHRQVGAVIVDRTSRIQGVGYNGFPRGCNDGRFPWARTSLDGNVLHTKYPYVMHAEANAILNKNAESLEGSTLYVTVFPCNECAKTIVQAGIRNVVVLEPEIEPTSDQEVQYRFQASHALFQHAGIHVSRWTRALKLDVKFD